MKKRIQKKILKKRKPLLAAVVEILDDIDPMGLLYSASKAGFPLEAEYEPEAKDLVCRLNEKMNLKDIETELRQIFDYWFHDPDIPGEFYMVAARNIMNAWLVFQERQAVDYPDDIELPQHPEPIIVEVD
jgi:hypothetical protein